LFRIQFGSLFVSKKKDEADFTYPAATANPIHPNMKVTTTAEATRLTEHIATSAGETTANGKMETFTDTDTVVAQMGENFMLSDTFSSAPSFGSTDTTSHEIITKAAIESAS